MEETLGMIYDYLNVLAENVLERSMHMISTIRSLQNKDKMTHRGKRDNARRAEVRNHSLQMADV